MSFCDGASQVQPGVNPDYLPPPFLSSSTHAHFTKNLAPLSLNTTTAYVTIPASTFKLGVLPRFYSAHIACR